ncbi:FecCD family ABC transporter permease [Parapusillimonas sp. JC17]|uniref:FecCD family ABC transporter permease n=1 Tax=Parapusillimonas sp. JC17 TaxID=3445768 RepID=UPI003F9EF6BA
MQADYRIAPDPRADSESLRVRWAQHRRIVRRRWLIVAALAVLTIAAGLADLFTGPASLQPAQIIGGLLDPDTLTVPMRVVLWQVRMPVALMALLVGAALALAGAELQTILNNPLAEPFTLGVSSSAALGAALAIVLGWGVLGSDAAWLVPANAFVFALASLLFLQLMAQWRGAQTQTLVLFGIAIGFAAGAVLSLLQFIASEDALQQLVFWSMGSLARADWESVAILSAILTLTVPFSWRAAGQLTALRLGEDRARSFGINVPSLRRWALVRISLLAATAVAFVGTVGFVGLVGPHVARMIVGDGHRHLLPASILIGASMMALASVASKMLVPGVMLPIGIVTALVGLPVFMGLMMRQRGGRG